MQKRTALVTGANRGIGLEVCRQLANDGFAVILTARRESEGAGAARRLAEDGLEVGFRQLDVADDAGVASLAESLAADGISVDVLVNNAAVSLDGFNADVARRTLDANFYGPMRVTDVLLPSMRDGANIVMVSSGAGELSRFSRALMKQLTDPGLSRDALIALMEKFVADVAAGRYDREGWPRSAYSTSKAGLNALVRIMAQTLAERSIRINAVCPGWVRTDMGGRHASRSVAEGARSVVWAAELGEDGPTGGFFRDGRAIEW